MELFARYMGLTMVLNLLNILAIIFGLLFMHYSAKHRNHKLSTAWYVCGVIFGLWTVLVFLFKRKDFPGDKVKVCDQCGARYPQNFKVCSNCVIDLPENDSEIKKKQKNLSRIFGIAIIASEIIAVIIFGIFIGSAVDEIMNYEEQYRISVDGVFYDKKGNAYEDESSVLLYGEDGKVYTLIAEQSDVDVLSENYFYVSDTGEKYYELDCYVTADGWFYCDKGGLLELYSEDTDTMTEEELDEYYENYINGFDDEYRYYDYPYVDADGNFYYCAYEASWDEKGELIIAENDPSLN